MILNLYNMLRRMFHVSCAVFSAKKQGVKLMKMLDPKKKKQFYPVQSCDVPLPTLKGLTKTEREPGKRGLRRISMLNKMFMKHITDLMSTGTESMNIVGRGIEISKVRVSPEFNTVNVFWVCKGNSTDKETEALLAKVAGPLRHELSSLRAMGEVPYIVFVKDRNEAIIVDLDRRLAEADYGEDYTPTEIGHLLKTEFSLDTKLSPEMKMKIKQLEDNLPIIEEAIPEMTHTVYGLDHELLMNRLRAARRKSKEAWSNLSSEAPVISYRAPEVAGEAVDVSKQKQDLADFLLKRQILQNKLHKQMMDSRAESRLLDNDDDDDEEVYYTDDEAMYGEESYYHEEERPLTDRDKERH